MVAMATIHFLLLKRLPWPFEQAFQSGAPDSWRLTVAAEEYRGRVPFVLFGHTG